MNISINKVIARNEALKESRLQLFTERNHFKRQAELKAIECESLRTHIALHQVVIVLLFIALMLVLWGVHYG